MSDYGSDVVTRNRRWLPSQPLNRHPMSPTIPIAKLRLYRELAFNSTASKSLTDLPRSSSSSFNQFRSSSASHSRTFNRPSSVLSYSSTPTPMDRVTLSYPGTPTKSNGYLQQQQQHQQQQHHLHQHLSGSATGIGYGRPSSINLHHPSNQYSPDPYVQGTWSLGSHRQSAYQDRYYPSGTNYPTSSSYNPHLAATGSYQRDLITTSPSAYARRNVALPIHSSSSAAAAAAALATRSSALPGSAGYYRQHHHSDHDLRYIRDPLVAGSSSSYAGVPGYGSTGYVQSPAVHRSSGYNPSATHGTTGNSSYYYQQYPHHHSRSRHYRSESDLDTLSNLYPTYTSGGGAHSYHQQQSATMGPSVHSQQQAYPTSSSYYGQHQHDPYQQSLEHSRYAQSNPYTIYPGYGQSAGTINATSTATNRYNRSSDRYY